MWIHDHLKEVVLFPQKHKFLVAGHPRSLQRVMPYLDPAFRHELNDVVVIRPALPNSETRYLRVRRSRRELLAVGHPFNLAIILAVNFPFPRISVALDVV